MVPGLRPTSPVASQVSEVSVHQRFVPPHWQGHEDGYLDRQCHTEECMFTQWVPGHLQPQLGLEVQGVTTFLTDVEFEAR